jgi:hypothetical protein
MISRTRRRGIIWMPCADRFSKGRNPSRSGTINHNSAKIEGVRGRGDRPLCAPAAHGWPRFVGVTASEKGCNAEGLLADYASRYVRDPRWPRRRVFRDIRPRDSKQRRLCGPRGDAVLAAMPNQYRYSRAPSSICLGTVGRASALDAGFFHGVQYLKLRGQTVDGGPRGTARSSITYRHPTRIEPGATYLREERRALSTCRDTPSV